MTTLDTPASECGALERKNYRIAPRGRKLLKQLRGEVEGSYRELLPGAEPEHREGGAQR